MMTMRRHLRSINVSSRSLQFLQVGKTHSPRRPSSQEAIPPRGRDVKLVREDELRRKLEDWLCAAHGWRCTCGGPAMVLCNACAIHTTLEAVAGKFRSNDWHAPYRGVRRAAGLEGDLEALRLEMEQRAYEPYEEMVVTGLEGDLEALRLEMERRAYEPYEEMVVTVPLSGLFELAAARKQANEVERRWS